jgi:hypothetical protein
VSTTFVVGYDDDVGVPDMEMLMAMTNVMNASDELTYILGIWLSGVRPAENEHLVPAQVRLVDLVPGLAVEVGANGPSWTFRLESSSGDSDTSLRQLGWQPGADAPAEFELSAELEQVRRGEIVARTITDVCGLVVRDLFWEMLEIGDAKQRLRQFATTGRI